MQSSNDSHDPLVHTSPHFTVIQMFDDYTATFISEVMVVASDGYELLYPESEHNIEPLGLGPLSLCIPGCTTETVVAATLHFT